MSACVLRLSISLSTVPGRLGEGSQPAADPSVLRPRRVQRWAHGEAPGRLAEADPAGGGEAHRDRCARGLQQDLQHPLLWGVHHHEPRGHRPLAAHRRDDRSLYTLCRRAAAGGMTGRVASVGSNWTGGNRCAGVFVICNVSLIFSLKVHRKICEWLEICSFEVSWCTGG